MRQTMNGTDNDVLWEEDHEEMLWQYTCRQWPVNSVTCLYVLLQKYSQYLDSKD